MATTPELDPELLEAIHSLTAFFFPDGLDYWKYGTESILGKETEDGKVLIEIVLKKEV